MSGTQRLYPNAFTQSSGTIVNQSGSSTSANLVSALKDDNTTTYIRCSDNTNLSCDVTFDNMTSLPSGARITSVVPYIKGKTFATSSGAYFGAYLKYANVLTTVTNPFWYRWVTYVSYATTAGPTLTTYTNGDLFTETNVNDFYITLKYLNTSAYKAWVTNYSVMRITEMYVDVSYDEKPVTSAVTATNTANTLRPTITWTYTDDLQAQVKARIEIYRDSDDVLIYDSGDLNTSDAQFTIPQNLRVGIAYYAKVKTAQYWGLPGGDFWSDYATSANFTITVSAPPRGVISVLANEAGWYNEVTVSTSAFSSGYVQGDAYLAIQGLDLPDFPDLTPSQFFALASSNPSLYAQYVSQISDKFDEGFGLNSWKHIETKSIPLNATSLVFHDYTGKSGVSRIYRTYTYRYDSAFDVDLTNEDEVDSYSSGYAPQMVTFDAAVLSAQEPDVNPTTGDTIENEYNAYQFMFTNATSNGSETFSKEAQVFQVAGRVYPIVDYGTSESKTVSATIRLYTDEEEAAFRTLDSRHCPVVFRDWRGQRIRGIMNETQYSNQKWGTEVSFTITATGEQFT